jgi:protein-arginine kinase activator protein McsA
MEWLNKKNELETAVNNGESYESLGRNYNVSGAYIKKVCKKLGIFLPRRRKINPNETFNKGKTAVKICKNCGKEFVSTDRNSVFCCIECSNEYKREQKYKDYLDNPEPYMGRLYMSWIKPHIFKEQEGKCAICGIASTWNNKPLVLTLDHIDGKAKNNLRSNIRLICPNCDSQLETYKSKNKHSDRIYYHFHHR